MHETEKKLALAWAEGDASAGEQLIAKYFDGIVRFFRTKAPNEVDDLVQRTFLRTAESSRRFRGDGSFRAFVFGVARNVLLEHIRSRYREQGRIDPDFGMSSIRDLDAGVSAIAWQREEQRLMVTALQSLPLQDQLVLELFYWEELSVIELAEVLEIAIGTVKSRLHRARGRLRELMEEMLATPEVSRAVHQSFGHWTREGPPGAKP